MVACLASLGGFGGTPRATQAKTTESAKSSRQRGASILRHVLSAVIRLVAGPNRL